MYTAYELCSEAVRHTMTYADYVMTISLIQPSALSHKPITNHREVTLETFHDYWMGSQFVLGLRREQKGAAACSVWSSNEVNRTPYNYHHTSCIYQCTHRRRFLYACRLEVSQSDDIYAK